ncbi:MAG TPA: sigma-70 family RNA polymerase sigma factor [Nevskiaceae bacterium]|nr:sigma-70 family RNA polymerase sigma factor [Nevskiaceae bacterium]
MEPSSAPFDQPLDPLVLGRARRGERSAQAAIYERYGRAVYTLARRMTGCEATAADVLQDSFLHAFERLHQYRGEAPFGHWLRRIAATQSLMQLRAQRRWLPLPDEDLEADDTPRLPVIEAADLEQALALLDATARAVLWLYHVEGYRHAEIAAMAGKTVSFSKSQLARAHQKLQARFGLAPAAGCAPALT